MIQSDVLENILIDELKKLEEETISQGIPYNKNLEVDFTVEEQIGMLKWWMNRKKINKNKYE